MSTAAIAYEIEQLRDLPRTPGTLPGFGQRVTARRPALGVEEMVVDIFAGAGGASLGIESALGRCVDRAINHNPLMIQMHEANHPGTKHLPGDVWDYKPLQVTGGRPVGLLWASPDCTHFSRAKGGKPVSKKIRALAWVVIRWAREVRPRVIILENVPEFQTWGPLDSEGRPDREKKGKTFRAWKRALERAGYVVEHRELVAADYGVPTIRKRFFLIARCDGEAIAWPEQTHSSKKEIERERARNHEGSGDRARHEGGGEGTGGDAQQGAQQSRRASRFRVPNGDQQRAASNRERPREVDGRQDLRPWRSAAECIDWALRCPSIFERKKPLAEATQRRIANGIRRYVMDAPPPGPFIVTCNHAGAEHRTRPLREPAPTITAKHRLGLVTVGGHDYVISDIGLRMLTPRELLRAQFGRFADDYVLIGTQAQQVAGIGNSVPPELAELLVKANVKIKRIRREEAA